MKVVYVLGLVGFTAFSVHGQVPVYGQCGGKGWTGPTTCVSGAVCTYQNDYYRQCLVASAMLSDSSTSTTTTTANACVTPVTTNEASLYGQCGGKGWTGATTCAKGSVCTYQNDYYSQCLSIGNSDTTTSTETTSATTSLPSTSTTTSSHSTPTITNSHSTVTTSSSAVQTSSSTSTTPAATCTATPPTSGGKLKYAGVNIAGFDFGINTDGAGTASGAYPPLPIYYGSDGPAQMAHFVNDDQYNVFRIPTQWQFLTDDAPTGALNQESFAKYDTLVKACLATGAHCMLDIHNYARWNGDIIGQGGPSNEVFADLWRSLASHYAGESKVMFGIMNEPHDLPSLALWAQTVQAAVTAIRKAGATTQIILLPGDHYTSAQTFVSGGSANALSAITNPDGSRDNLVFDVHHYLDSDASGTSDTCISDGIVDVWEPLAQWLRCNGRQALITETGGGNTPSCEKYMCQQIHYLGKNSDAFLGYVGWGAGSFSTTYTLSETPTKNGNTWTDQPLVSTCMAPSVNGYVE